MFNAVAIVSALHLLSEASIPECQDGWGQLRYERIIDTIRDPNIKPSDAVRIKGIPGEILGRCEDLCLRDKTSEQDMNSVCSAFDFVPGKRISSYSNALDYTETKCFTYRPVSEFDSPRYITVNGSFHMREVCYKGSVVKKECPTEKYVMERIREMSFIPNDAIQVPVSTLEECQNRCLGQYADDPVNNTRVCRSGSFDRSNNRCYHSAYTRRTHPNILQRNPSADYFENTCLSVDRRCPKNKLMFVKETNKELGGAYDTDVHENLSFDECKAKCLDGDNIFCRSFEYDVQTKMCVISDEDSISRPGDMAPPTSENNQYYQLLCIDGDNVKGEYVFEDSDTQQLNQRRYRDIRTAFQLYRNSRLQLNSGFRGSRGRERSRLTLAECLDECLEERAFTCRSVMYSSRYQTCQLSEYDQLNGNLVYDSEFDYYENLMGNDLGFGTSSSTYNRPSSGSSASNRYPTSSSGGLASSRCYDSDSFEAVGTRLRLRAPYIRDYVSVSSLSDCKRECLNQRSYTCRSFNYRYGGTRDNCELSDEDTHTFLHLTNPSHFETDSTSDYYEHVGNQGSDCHDVTQLCTEDGMEFTLRTDEPFRGRIYTYGYYDRCFSRGSGSGVNVLKISGPRGFPDCGTTKYGDTTTNIVVVQFSDNVQTSLDKRYNLTCTVVGPGEAVVTSGYIGAGSGAPTPIEYLPAENQLQSKVRLQIMYGGRPTTTIAVGDPLTFKLESQRGFNLVSDIFATNVVAKDPYSGRSVQLIDNRGCPLDSYVFPALGKGREGNALEARFNAFKIPESNFLIFEATVRTCRGGCTPARCTIGNGREEIESYGRRRRRRSEDSTTSSSFVDDSYDEEEEDKEEQVHGIYEVYMTRDEIDEPLPQVLLDEVCLATAEYYTLVMGLVITIICLLGALGAVVFCFRKNRRLDSKNAMADAGNPYHNNSSSSSPPHQQHLQQKSKFAFPGSHARTLTQPASYFPSNETTASAPQGEDGAATSSRYPDPSEPIYTDPGLFERAKSLRGVLDEPEMSSSRRRFADGED